MPTSITDNTTIINHIYLIYLHPCSSNPSLETCMASKEIEIRNPKNPIVINKIGVQP